MKVLAITLLALVAVVTSRNLNLEDKIELEEISAYGYHRKYGIPLADAIRETEARGESRIAGGITARLGDLPYQAGLIITFTNGGQSACGGCIVNTRRVLTAAHCWWDGEKRGRIVTVVAGSVALFSGGQRQPSSSVVMHGSWNPSRRPNDIAMINLSLALGFGGNVNSVALPTVNELNLSFVGATGTVAGFGQVNDNPGISQSTVLRFVSAPVITNAVCQQSLPSITATNICTRGPAGRSPCPGDSGGPLVVTNNNRRVLIGLVSFGRDSCLRGDPVAYVRVTSFMPWITNRL